MMLFKTTLILLISRSFLNYCVAIAQETKKANIKKANIKPISIKSQYQGFFMSCFTGMMLFKTTLILLVSRSFLDYCVASLSLQQVIFRVLIDGKPVAKFKT